MTLARNTPLKRAKRLKAKPRAKGNRAELAVIEMCKERGWPARRNWMSGGMGGSDIIGGPPGTALEVKHCQRTMVWQWIDQCEAAAAPTETPIVVHRRNNKPFYGILPSDDLAPLLHNVGILHYRLRCESQRLRLWALIAEAEHNLEDRAIVEFSRPGREWYSNLRFDWLLDLLRRAEG